MVVFIKKSGWATGSLLKGCDLLKETKLEVFNLNKNGIKREKVLLKKFVFWKHIFILFCLKMAVFR